MKTRELLLLCLFSFISMSVNAGQYQKNERKIRLEKHDSKNSPEKAGRSTIPFEVFAYLNSDYELISVDLDFSFSISLTTICLLLFCSCMFFSRTFCSDSRDALNVDILFSSFWRLIFLVSTLSFCSLRSAKISLSFLTIFFKTNLKEKDD